MTEHEQHDDRHPIGAYVGDMLALERHIAQPLARQDDAEKAGASAMASALLAEMRASNDAHIDALQRRLEELGGDPASGVKSGWASLIGAGAATIDAVRKTPVSKGLRDDYAAFNLAAIGYTMLHTTALALRDGETAEMARRHLFDSARIAMRIAESMPEVVLRELHDDGVRVDTGVADEARKNTEESWRRAGESVAGRPA